MYPLQTDEVEAKYAAFGGVLDTKLMQSLGFNVEIPEGVLHPCSPNHATSPEDGFRVGSDQATHHPPSPPPPSQVLLYEDGAA